mmetsp:Transcript_80655/g.224478  ORF Transcript_80655/g.224478 Transcript_80655/m.224478 type:complete len:215 (+) Transcript_80655:262-906(+)
MRTMSRNIVIALSMVLNLDPGMSIQDTGTSAILLPKTRARSRTSTSKAQPWRWTEEKMRLPTSARKSLKPHCVSWICQPTSAQTRTSKASVTAFCSLDVLGMDSSRKWYRDPKTICTPPSLPPRPATLGPRARSRRSRSPIRVAPSASASSSSWPLAASMPACTAKPFPRFQLSCNTRSSPQALPLRRPCPRPHDPSAAAKVASKLPSSTTRTS